MIDLSELDTGAACDAGAEIEILHPKTRAGTGIFITVLGKDSEVFQEHQKHRLNERLRRDANNERRGKPADPPTAEEIEAKAIETLVLCTTGWRTEIPVKDGKKGEVENKPCLLYKGEELAFNVANAKRVYTEILEIRRQVDNAIGDLENFMSA